jgi:large subunit ribosomal protein L10
MTAKEQKKQDLQNLLELLDGATGIYVINFEKIKVAEDFAFRNTIKEMGCKYKVFKNTIIKRAFAQTEGIDIPEELLFGQSGIIFSYDDATAPAKLIKAKFDKEGKPALKAASIEGQVFDGKQLNVVASLPTKEDLLASILGSLNAPASGIHGCLNSLMRDIASMIEEVGKKNAA